MCCQEASLLGWLRCPGPWAQSTPHVLLPLFSLQPYDLHVMSSKQGLSVPGYCVGVFREARKHSLGLGNDLKSDGSTAFPEHGALQGAKISVLSWRNYTGFPSDVICQSVSPEPRSHSPRLAASHTGALESTLDSKILMFRHFCLVRKNGFHYFFVCSGNVMNLIYNFQSKFELL